MAWRVAKVEENRREFIEQVYRRDKTISDLCIEFQISRKTAYKWMQRYKDCGDEGLKDRSRAPHSQPSKTNESQVQRILEVKHKYPSWGPKKVLAKLEVYYPDEYWPSDTTIGNILDRNGLVNRKKCRRRFPAKSDPLSHCSLPNDVWSVDFKGWFLTKDGIKCDPLTVSDAHSRFILECVKLHSGKEKDVWKILEALFYKYGLPKYLRHDNGPPFATMGVGRLSALSVKIIKAGVIPEWIDPGKPYQNGRHERMHKTLKADGILPFVLTLDEQQMRFRDFLHYYNYERPHEALGQRMPGHIYAPSDRNWNGHFRSPEYDEGYIVKQVRDRGLLSWNGIDIYIGKTLKNERIGIKEDNNGDWGVHFGPVYLGIIDPKGNLITPVVSYKVKRKFKFRCY
jgi:transposase InsO family protein